MAYQSIHTGQQMDNAIHEVLSASLVKKYTLSSSGTGLINNRISASPYRCKLQLKMSTLAGLLTNSTQNKKYRLYIENGWCSPHNKYFDVEFEGIYTGSNTFAGKLTIVGVAEFTISTNGYLKLTNILVNNDSINKSSTLTLSGDLININHALISSGLLGLIELLAATSNTSGINMYLILNNIVWTGSGGYSGGSAGSLSIMCDQMLNSSLGMSAMVVYPWGGSMYFDLLTMYAPSFAASKGYNTIVSFEDPGPGGELTTTKTSSYYIAGNIIG